MDDDLDGSDEYSWEDEQPTEYDPAAGRVVPYGPSAEDAPGAVAGRPDVGSGGTAAGPADGAAVGGASGRGAAAVAAVVSVSPKTKKREWLLRMNRRLAETPVGSLDPTVVPLSAVMNAWAKTKSSEGASMVELWLNRSQDEERAGNTLPGVRPTTKMYTMSCDAWAKSGEGGRAAQRAEAILQHMNSLYQSGAHEGLRPTTGIFNAVINAWARSREKIAPVRAEQILDWMDTLHRRGNLDIKPDKVG